MRDSSLLCTHTYNCIYNFGSAIVLRLVSCIMIHKAYLSISLIGGCPRRCETTSNIRRLWPLDATQSCLSPWVKTTPDTRGRVSWPAADTVQWTRSLCARRSRSSCTHTHSHTHTHTRVGLCDLRCVCFGLRVWEPLPRPIVVQVDTGDNSPPVRGLAWGGLLVEFVNLL